MMPLYLAVPDRPGLHAALAAQGVPLSPPGDAGDGAWLGWLPPTSSPAATLDGARDAIIRALIVSGDEAAQLDALAAGADAVYPARQSDALIAAQLAALIRRRQGQRLVIGELAIDPLERRVWRSGRPIDLLPREYRLLGELARTPGVPVGRQHLLTQVCGLSFDPGTNVLEVHVSRLRAKLDRGFAFPLVRTEKGRGYSLYPGVEPARASG